LRYPAHHSSIWTSFPAASVTTTRMSPLALIVATTTRLSLCGRSDVREALGIGPGDYVAFEVVGSEAHVFKVMWTKA